MAVRFKLRAALAYAQSEAVPFVVRTVPYTTNNHSVNGLSTWCIVADYLDPVTKMQYPSTSGSGAKIGVQV